jgi:hypothetical protein
LANSGSAYSADENALGESGYFESALKAPQAQLVALPDKGLDVFDGSAMQVSAVSDRDLETLPNI